MAEIHQLIEMLNISNKKGWEYSGREFADRLRAGMATEPELFPHLVDTAKRRVRRAFYGEMPENDARRDALAEIAMYAAMADYDVLATGQARMLLWFQYYHTRDHHGPAMRAFRDYLDRQGLSLEDISMWD